MLIFTFSDHDFKSNIHIYNIIIINELSKTIYNYWSGYIHVTIIIIIINIR